jgi:membrane fusion protein, multidrug efflux system
MISKPKLSAPDVVPDVVKDGTSSSLKLVEGHVPRTLDRGSDTAAPTPKTNWWLRVLVICVVVAAWYYRISWLPWITPMLSGSVPPPKTAARAVPVVTATVQQRDMNLYLNGLGLVTAFKTVTIRSRVEGELINVAFDEGQMVREGELLAEIDPRPFEVQREQAEGQLAKDEATLKAAKLTLSRLKELLTTKSATAQEVDEQSAMVQQVEGTLRADQATVANAKLQLTYCNIVAPINGRIGLRLVDQGNIVRANDPSGLAVITQLQPIALVFTIPQDDIARVLKQMREQATLTVDAFDRDFKTNLASGKLMAIDNQVDPTTGTVRLKAMFENEDGLLFPNQFVNARLHVDTKRDAIMVPSAAVQRGPTSMFVYVVQADETVELRNVVIGPTEGAETSIESGLAAGEIVVTEGLDKLQPGAKITTREKERKSDSADSKKQPANQREEAGKKDSR